MWVWFVLFITIHVALVVTTGVLANLNHITSGRDDSSWLGFWLFAAWMAVVIVGWVAATPLTLRRPRLIQRVGSALLGPTQRLFEHIDPKPGQYTGLLHSGLVGRGQVGRRGHADHRRPGPTLPRRQAHRCACATKSKSASNKSNGSTVLSLWPTFHDVGGGYGGYNQDHEFFGYRQAI